MNTEQNLEDETPASAGDDWKEAKKISSLVGEVPSLFSTALHFLKIDARDNDGVLSIDSKSTLKILLNSSSFAAAIYKAARTYRPVDTAKTVFKNRIELASVFSAGELHSLISLLYLYRRIRKGCDPEFFVPYTKRLIKDIELAGLIGTAIPAIGLPNALLVTGFPCLGQAMFLGIDKQGFEKYVKKLKHNNEEHNLLLEQEKWGCNHLQITALILQNLSAGSKVFDSVVLGVSAPTLDEAEKLGGPNGYKGKLVRVWIDSLLETGKAPDMAHKGQFYPLSDDLAVLESAAKKLMKDDDVSGWINATKEDLTSDIFSEEADDLDTLV